MGSIVVNENLEKGVRITKETAREMGRRGAEAANKKKREKKTMREIAEMILNMPLYSGKGTDADDIKNLAAAKGKNISVETAIIIAQAQKAMKGDTQAASWLRDTAGQKPTDKVEADIGTMVVFSGEDELED